MWSLKELLICDVAPKVEALTKRKYKLMSTEQELEFPFYISHNLYSGCATTTAKFPECLYCQLLLQQQ
jgi:hypothetical protein